MDEDQYWQFLEEQTTEQLRAMEADEDNFNAERTPEFVWEMYQGYVSQKYEDMLNS